MQWVCQHPARQWEHEYCQHHSVGERRICASAVPKDCLQAAKGLLCRCSRRTVSTHISWKAKADASSVFFLFSFFVDLALVMQRRREKAFGPSPKNNYTSGTEKRSFWQRKPKRDSEYRDSGLEAQKRGPDSLPQHATPGDMRASYQTNTTAVGQEAPAHTRYGPTVPTQRWPRFAQTGHPAHIGQADRAGYTTQPTTYGASADAQYPDRQNIRGSYLQYGTQGAPYGVAQKAELSGEEAYRT